MIVFGLVLIAAREREQAVRRRSTGATPSMPAWSWRSPPSRSPLFEWLGFLTTDVLLIFALLVVIERRRLLPAAVYSVGVVVRHLRAVRLRAQDAARHRAVRLLGTIRGTAPCTACCSASRSRCQPANLWYAFLGCLVGTLVGVLPGIGPLAGISHPAAGDLRPQRHARPSSCWPASITARNMAARPPRS